MQDNTTESQISNLSLAITIFQNIGRDITWAVWAEKQWNFQFDSTPNDFGIRGEWAPQFLYGSLAAILATLISAAACKMKGQEIPATNMFASLVGTMAAIIPWNAGQNLGMMLGQYLNWSQTASAVSASAFTGVFEGITQFLMIKLTAKLADPEERRQFCEDPKKYLSECFDKETLKLFAKEFGYSLTIGAIPGAVWQLVFTACGLMGLGAISTGLLVALAVAICNFGVAKIQTAVLHQFFHPENKLFNDAQEERIYEPDAYNRIRLDQIPAVGISP